ncbi:Helicase, putative [Hondaea fermentalgiana]|uniref:Helicase, putative n=1 Tax=Hondaea fermentalgiana TaxID=2315210 RepID=A0A2R5GFW3_9STRA|nr:Helicase, putative [Hondaea fermentalgiana]|eukprot:GBG27141.1 Helicase, putative [Hondaea fermentalgiana]
MSKEKGSKYFLPQTLLQHGGVVDDEDDEDGVANAVFEKVEASGKPKRPRDAGRHAGLLGRVIGARSPQNQRLNEDGGAQGKPKPRSQAIAKHPTSRRVTASPMAGVSDSSSDSEVDLDIHASSNGKTTAASKGKVLKKKKKHTKESTSKRASSPYENGKRQFRDLESSSSEDEEDGLGDGRTKVVRASGGGKKLVRKGRTLEKRGASEKNGKRLRRSGASGSGNKAAKPRKTSVVEIEDSDDSDVIQMDSDADEDALDVLERRAEAIMDVASSDSESDSDAESDQDDEDEDEDDDDDGDEQRGNGNDDDIDENVSGDDSDSEHREVRSMFDNCEAISKRLAKSVREMHLDDNSAEGKARAKKMQLVSRENADELFPGNFSLKDYQLVGLNWLRLLYSQDLNGILADEMGLGKTVQAIAILAWLRKTQGTSGPHLVVAPGSTLENWRREVQRWIPWARTEVYHGLQADRNEIVARLERGARKNPQVDVIITTYTYFERDSSTADRAFLGKFNFEYIIYDEAHGLKSMNSSRYRRLVRLSSRRRLLLSGTPVQNNLQELLALMSFCMPKVFNASSERLTDYFNDADNRGQASIARIRDAMRPFVLRRLKADVLGQLSPKIEDVQLLEMADVQRKVYSEIIDAYRQKKSDARSGRRSRATDSATTHFFSQLRKAANHPLLVRQYFGKSAEDSPDGVSRPLPRFVELCDRVKAFGPAASVRMIEKEIKSYSDWDFHLLALEFGSRNAELRGMALPQEALWTSSKALRLRELLPKLVEEKHRFLIFSQWTTLLDVIEEMLGALNITFVRFDGSTAIGDRQEIIDSYNTDMSISACLLSTRAGGMGVNLTSADTVILHDLDWSHATDRQAEDRCHRIGQTKPVRIIKLVTRETVDQNILQIQTRKKHLEAALLISSSGPNSQQTQRVVSQDDDIDVTGGPDAELEAALANDLDPISIIMNRL